MIQVTRSNMPPFEEYISEIRSIWDTRWLTNMGEKHDRLQDALRQYLDVPHVSLFANGHLALEGVIEALGLTGEIITTPYTFASTTHAIVRRGLTPVFCDINAHDYTLDVSKLERLITERTSAILPVHVYGNLCDVAAIDRLAEKYHLKVVYDAAHAFGVRSNGVSAASFGDASMFSFHATKVFHSVEGGAVVYRDDALTRKLGFSRDFGIDGPEAVRFPGGNGKMSEFHAAMGLCNLRHVDDEIALRRAVAARYSANLSGIPGLHVHQDQPGVTWNCAYYPVLFDGFKLTRDAACQKLASHEVMARKYFYPAVNAFACYRDRYDPADTPVAQFVSERILTLPMYGELPLEDVDRICEILLD